MTAAPPTISVIIPAFNGVRFLHRCIDSIKLQQWPGLEIIIVDDGSTDDLAGSIQTLTIPVQYIRQQRRGPAAARNVGVQHARAPLIAFLDIDDTWTAGHLSRMHHALQLHPEAGFAQGMMQQYSQFPDGRTLLSGTYLVPKLCACLFRKEVFVRMHGLDETLREGEDYDFICRCWEADIKRIWVDQTSVIYHRHADNTTKDGAQRGTLAVAQRRMQRIRTGLVDPAKTHSMTFPEYSSNTENFTKCQIETLPS